MTPDILIIHDNTGNRLLHGHLHLAMALNDTDQASVEVQDVETVLVTRTRDGLVVKIDDRCVPLLSRYGQQFCTFGAACRIHTRLH